MRSIGRILLRGVLLGLGLFALYLTLGLFGL